MVAYDNCLSSHRLNRLIYLTFRLLGAALVLLAGDPGGTGAASEAVRGPVPAEVIRVIDGDTIEVRAAVWIDVAVTVRVRLRGVDAPELTGARCPAEHAPIVLHDIRRDKYGGRVVAHVLATDGDDLGQALLTARLAHTVGAASGGWCQ